MNNNTNSDTSAFISSSAPKPFHHTHYVQRRQNLGLTRTTLDKKSPDISAAHEESGFVRVTIPICDRTAFQLVSNSIQAKLKS